MTISTTTIKNSYSGNGSTTAFTYSFKITAETEIQVIVKTNATGAESVRSIGTGSTNYSVSGVGNNSGTVTFVTAPLSTETVVLRRSTAQTQSMDLIDNDPMSAETIETAHDKAIAISQELQEQIDRSLKISRANTMTSTEFTTSAADRADKILSFDNNGELAVTQELGTFKGNSATTTTAAFVVRDIVKSTTTAQLNNIYICIQASPIGIALTNTSYWTLIVDAVSAASSATAAASSASTASTQASAAASSATAAASSASTASTQATNASNSATAAASSASAAATSYDNFDDRYLGQKSSDPSTDNDGASLLTGALYFNTSNNVMMVYSGSAWVRTTPTSSDQTNINTLAASAVVADMALLATTDCIADMALLATTDIIADMNTLATSDIVSDINTLATSDIVSDLNTLATSDIVSDINTLATSDIVSDLNTLATSDIVSDINTLATSDIVSDLNTLATSDIVSDLNTLATSANVTNMATCAANIAGVNSFADRYRVASSDPSSSLDEGDLAFNTTDNNLKFYNGSSWTAISPGISNVADDGSPQLGADLDVVTYDLVSTSNRDIDIIPHGTGDVNLGADTVQVGDNNANATITTQGTGDLILNTNNGTNAGNITLLDGANGNISITPNGSGAVVIDGLSHPTADGSAGQFLKTNGSGTLSFAQVDATGLDTNAVTTAKINADAVTGAKIADDAIDSEHYVDGSIDNAHIADDAINSEHYAAGSIDTAHIADDQITYAKIQNVSADERILGRVSGANGVIEELTKAQMLTMLNVADGANAYTHPNHSGEVTSSADGATVIADNIVDEANLKVSNGPTDGQVLTARSGNTGGMTWEAASAGLDGTPAFSARLNSDQNMNGNSDVKLICGTEFFDTDSAYNTSNGRFTVPSGKGGNYLFCWGVRMNNISNVYLEGKIYKNGNWQTQFISQSITEGNNYTGTYGTAMLDMDAGDYMEFYCRHFGGNSKNIFGHSQIWSTWIAGYRVSED